MKRRLELSELQGAAVQSALDRLSVRAGRRLSLNALMNEWNVFVSEIERGYKECIYEYTNDLSVRDVLDELCSSVPANVRTAIEQKLNPIDIRYESATKPSTEPIVPGAVEKSARWYRIPKLLLEELKRDLEAGW